MFNKGGVFEVIQLYSNVPIGGNRIRTFNSLVLQPRLHRKGTSKDPAGVVQKLGNVRTSLRLEPRYLTTALKKADIDTEAKERPGSPKKIEDERTINMDGKSENSMRHVHALYFEGSAGLNQRNPDDPLMVSLNWSIWAAPIQRNHHLDKNG
ncbi:hypothetical protein AVEN_210458-1 [Araneus ventricosus]|uniref:Uncharacterized protein n=1 Tax=Araneus ventricosus TaxID=182803 RepID=A0A4Y2HT77_ARAVE|nr:hypothetical protein AVEN_210458-1 [Araneus ventricosus]